MRKRAWFLGAAMGLILAGLPLAQARAGQPPAPGSSPAAVLAGETGSVGGDAADPEAGEAGDAIPPWGRGLGEPVPPTMQEAFVSALFADISYRPRYWLNVEYLLWWTRNGTVPPLITRGDASDALPGALGQTYTKVLYGGAVNDINFEDRSGGRLTFGMPLDSLGDVGIEAGYFFLTARATGTAQASPGNPILAQPFFNALTQTNDSSLVSYPGQFQGTVAVRSTSLLQGGEVNGTALLWQRDNNTITLLGGLRYLNLTEDLQVGSISTGDSANPFGQIPAPAYVGALFAVRDRFQTWDDFYGGQLGIRADLQYRRLELNLLAKVALGDTHETVRIAGQTQTNYPAPLDAPAGLLALSSNSGTFSRDRFAIVPEAGVSLGLRITERLTLSVGYTLLYWSEVARPGSQVDLNLNPNLIPTSSTYGTAGGPARPAAAINGTDFWAQGLSFGLRWGY